MSKHWKPDDIVEGGHGNGRFRGLEDWRDFGDSTGRGIGPREILLTLVGGITAGLLVVAAGSWFSGSSETIDFSKFDVPDRWEESSRSRAILESQEGSPWGSRGRATTYAAAVRVIDGDTFELDGQRIRIADIDTPEVNGRCPAETALAARATARMSELLSEGPFELGAVGRDEDRYGRKLRIVIRDGRSVGDRLVAEGLARTWTGRREPWC
jgi:endonuclease YncB( thermonuclease family)